MAEKWTNTSSPPSVVMNPKSLASLNLLTVPFVFTGESPFCAASRRFETARFCVSKGKQRSGKLNGMGRCLIPSPPEFVNFSPVPLGGPAGASLPQGHPHNVAILLRRFVAVHRSGDFSGDGTLRQCLRHNASIVRVMHELDDVSRPDGRRRLDALSIDLHFAAPASL